MEDGKDVVQWVLPPSLSLTWLQLLGWQQQQCQPSPLLLQPDTVAVQSLAVFAPSHRLLTVRACDLSSSFARACGMLLCMLPFAWLVGCMHRCAHQNLTGRCSWKIKGWQTESRTETEKNWTQVMSTHQNCKMLRILGNINKWKHTQYSTTSSIIFVT